MEIKKIRVGVMGCANIAIRTVIPTIIQSSEFELVAVASRTQEKATMCSERFGCEGIVGYQNLVSRTDIDAIYMPLPTGLHEKWVIECLLANKHIIIEKSLAMDYESAAKMVDLANKRDLLIMENFMFVYHSQHKFIMDQISNGEIGELRCFRSSFGFPPLADDNFRYNKELGGGALLDAAAYTVRAGQLFLGNNLNVDAAKLNFCDKKVDVFGSAILSNPEGVCAQVAFGFDNYYQCNYELWGSKGKIVAHKSFTPKPNEKPLVTIETQDRVITLQLPSDDHFKNIFSEFSKEIISHNFQKKYSEILNQARLLNQIKSF